MHPAIILVNGAEQPLAPGTTVADVVAAVTGREVGADGAPVDGERLGVAAAVGDASCPAAAGRRPRSPPASRSRSSPPCRAAEMPDALRRSSSTVSS